MKRLGTCVKGEETNLLILNSFIALGIPLVAWLIMGVVLDYVCPENVPVLPPESGVK